MKKIVNLINHQKCINCRTYITIEINKEKEWLPKKLGKHMTSYSLFCQCMLDNNNKWRLCHGGLFGNEKLPSKFIRNKMINHWHDINCYLKLLKLYEDGVITDKQRRDGIGNPYLYLKNLGYNY